MNKIIERAHQHPQPFGFSEIERRDPVQSDFGNLERRTPHPDRGSRQPSLEAVRYLMLTLQDLVAATQSDWPIDRPKTQRVKESLSFSDFAIARLRNGALRRMAEEANEEQASNGRA